MSTISNVSQITGVRWCLQSLSPETKLVIIERRFSIRFLEADEPRNTIFVNSCKVTGRPGRVVQNVVTAFMQFIQQFYRVEREMLTRTKEHNDCSKKTEGLRLSDFVQHPYYCHLHYKLAHIVDGRSVR